MSILWNKPVFLLLAAGLCVVGVLLKSPVLLALSMLLVVFTFWRLPDAVALPVMDGREVAFYGCLLVGLGVSGLAASLSLQRNFKFHIVDTILWLVAILLVVGGALWHDRRLRLRSSERAASIPAHTRWLDISLICMITLAAVVLRVVDLPGLPPAVHGDEGEVGMLALRVLGNTGEPLPIFASTVFGHNPAGFPYLTAPFITLFGRNEVGLRMLAALSGAASASFLYLIGRRGWGVLAGATAAWLLAVSHFHIHYSRIAVPNIANAFLIVLLVWVLFRAYQRNAHFLAHSPAPATNNGSAIRTRLGTLRLAVPVADFVGIGLVIGFSQYVYHGSRLLLLVAAFAFLYMLVLRKATPLQLIVACLAALVVVAPLGTFFATHWEEFTGRSNDVFIFTERNLQNAMGPDATFAQDLLPYLNHQFVNTLSFITGSGDRSSFYVAELPIFDPVTLVLLWLGFGAVLAHIRRFEESVVAVWFLLGIVFAGFLTTEQPNGPRLISVAPACYLIGGILVQRIWALLPVAAHKNSRRLPVAVAGAVALLVLYLNWHTYFVEMPGYTHSILPTAVARAVASAPRDTPVYVMGDPIVYAGHGSIRFLAARQDVSDLRSPAELPPASADSGAFLIALEPHLGALQAIAEAYPGGEITSYQDSRGHFLYATYAILATEQS